jgi:arylsulfatase A-like enzyme
MGWKDVSYAGSTFYETPNIDQLASEGVFSFNACSPACVCTPSRGGIFSGKFPARTKLTNVFSGPAGPDDRLLRKSKYSGENGQCTEGLHRHALPKAEKIIAQALAEGGYQTGFFGKWHIGECPGYYPDDRGFHVAKGYRRVHGMKYGHWGYNWPKGNFANLPDPDSTEFIPETLTNECIKFIKVESGRSYTCYFCFR